MKIEEPTLYYIVYWSGQINDTRLRLDSFKGDTQVESFLFHSVMTPNKPWNKIFCCINDNTYMASQLTLKWIIYIEIFDINFFLLRK